VFLELRQPVFLADNEKCVNNQEGKGDVSRKKKGDLEKLLHNFWSKGSGKGVQFGEKQCRKSEITRGSVKTGKCSLDQVGEEKKSKVIGEN